ncbi:Leucine Rich Repeat [Seminavis robusta]|uniref:Leucine Rich Repeat n=1 Tax=Seminavis robusta TaxID=568900 RepID=A0A9N8D626_9STRA|nr:Leucine Rich Repeat [Seminavis robusta]|eukprot:Sro14_g010430.1 Leucine Rich Repeat (497) ;mRNA; r:27936-29426
MTAYHDHGLVHARPVSVLPTGTVEPFDEERASRRKIAQQRSLFYLLVPWALCVIVLVTVGLIVFLTAGKDTTAAPSPLPESHNNNNTNDETPVVGWTWDLPFSLPNYTLHTLKYDTNYTKPQSKAHLWMKNDPNLHNYTEERLIQRFAMATFYYATVGEEWTHQGGGTVTVTADAAGRPGGRRQLQPPGGGSGGLKEVNITSEPWLSYNASECTWLSSSPLRKKEACNENHTLENLELLGNGLAGTLPEELGLLTSLTYIKLGKDNIGGTIISQFGSLPKLWGLHLFGSRLTGTIPSELGLLSNTLKGFAVQGNFLSGSLPSEFWQLRELKELRIANNPLELSIPNGMHKYMPKFRVLYAARLATLDGSLPTTLGLLTGLSHFNIEENAVTGPLPSELATLTKLGSIIASNNHLTGSLPSEYGLFHSLESLDLRGNMGMVGPFSPELANLNDTLEVLDLQDTSITGTIPEELCGLESLNFACSPSLCGCDCTCMEL